MKYFFAVICVLGMAVAYQNCDGGVSSLDSNTNKSNAPLSFKFDNIQQDALASSTTIIVEGSCNVSGYADHRVDWEYTYLGSRVQGRTDRPCSPFNRFSLVIDVSGLSRAVNSELTLVGVIYGLKGSATTRGATGQVKVVFRSTTSGTTTGGNTGNTGTGNYCSNFASQCPDEVTNGVQEYCCNDTGFNSFCSSITYPPNASPVVNQVASERPDLIQKCARGPADNSGWKDFSTEVVRRLRLQNGNWGFNGVRGNINDINGDTISWWGAPSAQPVEGGEGNVIIDIVASCGLNNTPTWQVSNAYCSCCTKMGRWTRGGL